LVLPIIAYTLSSTKLEIRTNSFCQVVRGYGERGRGSGKGGEMTQTLYTNMNKIKIQKKVRPYLQNIHS
jgi:hypothetical protein